MKPDQRDHSPDADTQAALAGDRDALRRLWHEHRRWVAAVLLAHKPSEAEVDDLLQDVAMKLVSNISTVRDPSSLRAWLRMVAVNVAREAGRKKLSRPEFASDSLDATVDTSASRGRLSAADEAQDLFHQAMALPESYREPLLLSTVRGMTTKHVAEALDLPMTTVATRIARARNMLKQQVFDADNFDASSNGRAPGNHVPSTRGER